MNQELFKAFNTAFSRAKKSKTEYLVVPDSRGPYITNSDYSIKYKQLFYMVKESGLIIKHNDGLVFNLGKLDNLLIDDYT
jgi:hypothetical protein